MFTLFRNIIFILGLNIAASLLMPLATPAYGQAVHNVSERDNEEQSAPSYGEFEYIEVLDQAIQELRETRPVKDGLRRYSYLARVGGIAFDKSAIPSSTLLGGDLLLSYNPAMPDGRRFSVTISGTKYILPGHDWKLIPILSYANSPYYSCFSLFGTTGDQARDKQIRDAHKLSYICAYHPSFKNTLLGLRLMQMDSILTDLNAYDRLPTARNGREILGAGEDRINRIGGAYEKKRNLIALIERHGEYSAYVISDSSTDIVFRTEANAIRLSGEISFHFWKAHGDFDGIQTRIQKEVAEKYNVTLLPGGIIEGASHASLDKFKEEAERLIDTSLVVPLEPLSNAVSREITMIAEINPVVYEAVRDVMRYGAFFRYCKSKSPVTFDQTLLAVRKVKITPAVKTPNCVTE